MQAINDTLFLFGKVKTAAEQQQAEAVAAAYTKNVQQLHPARPGWRRAGAPGGGGRGQPRSTRSSLAAPCAPGALTDGTTVVLEGNVDRGCRRSGPPRRRGDGEGCVTIVDYFQAGAAGAKQVLVRSRVIDIDRIKTRELGLDWGPVQNVLGAGGIVKKIVGEQPFSFGEARNGPLGLGQGGPLSRFDPIGFKLHALENQNAARVLSEPNLLVMEGHKGGILIGGEIPIPVAQQSGTGVGTSITVEYKPFGIRLDVEVMGITGDDDDAADFARGELARLHQRGDGQRLQPSGPPDPPRGQRGQDPERPDAGDRRPAAERHQQAGQGDPVPLQASRSWASCSRTPSSRRARASW